MGIHANAANQLAGCNRIVAFSRRPSPFVNARKVPCRLIEQSERPVSSTNRRRNIYRIQASSLEAEAEKLTEEAAHSVPNLNPEDRILPWDDNRGGLRKWLDRTLKSLTKKAWIAALALFYLYNEAVAKLPWVKMKRFETWFWTTCRSRWQHSMHAASVLGNKYWRDYSKNLNWRSTKARLAQKKVEMEGEMQENVEHVKQDIEETVEHQKDTVNQKVPAKVNPLLLRENLQERVASAMEASGLGNHVDAAVEKVKDAVPILKSSDALAKAEAEAEAKAAAEAEQAELLANASASAASPGIVNLPVHTQITLPSIAADDGASSSGESSSSSGKSSFSTKSPAGKRTGEPRLTKTFLPLFWQGKDGEASKEHEKQPEEADSNGRKWPLPILFWK